MKLAICTNFVSPYRRPLFRAISHLTGWDVRIFTNTGMEHDRAWEQRVHAGEPYTVVQSFSCSRTKTLRSAAGITNDIFTQRVQQHFPVGLAYDLARWSPHAIISGELGARTMCAFAAGAIMGIPVIPWTYHPRAQRGIAGRASRLRRSMLHHAPAVIGMGTQAREVLTSIGCEDTKIFNAPNACDVNAVARRLQSEQHKIAVSSIQNRFNRKRIALVVGRLVPMKGITRILSAWENIPQHIRDQWALVFVGDGPQRDILAQTHASNVHHVGHVPPEQLPDWYTAADLHIFASLGDPWGLVVNEAMQCSTPTLCSVRAGCCDDLIVNNTNGLTFDPCEDIACVTKDIELALTDPNLTAMGKQAQHDVASYTPQHMAQGMVDAVQFAMGETSPTKIHRPHRKPKSKACHL